MKRYELWRSAEEISEAFFEAGNESARQLLEPDARLIWVTEASSWEEAQQKRYDYMGWGLYHRLGEQVN